MNLLAFDTSTEYLSIALLKDMQIFRFDTLAHQAHSKMILPQIQSLLNQAQVQLADLHGIAFGAGPGSFTGVRIAAGVAQGLAFGHQLPVVDICTLLALAEASGHNQVIACLDARMGEVYYAAYQKVLDVWQVVEHPNVYKPHQVPNLQGDGWVGAGSGWQTYTDVLNHQYHGQLQSVLPSLLPTAASIITLAQPVFLSGHAKSAMLAMPMYVRNRVALKTTERMQGLSL